MHQAAMHQALASSSLPAGATWRYPLHLAPHHPLPTHLAVQEESGIHGTLRVHLAPTHIVLELQGDCSRTGGRPP